MLNQSKVPDHRCDAHPTNQSMAMPNHTIFEDLKSKVEIIFRITIVNSEVASLHFEGPVVPDEQYTPTASFSASTRIGL